MINQEKLRNLVKRLKWQYNINYKEIANQINMNENSFYNFVSGKKSNLSHKRVWMLNNYIDSIISDEDK